MVQPEQLSVSVAYALPERQSVVPLKLPRGATVLDAVQKSGLLIRYPDIASRSPAFAIFGRAVTAATVLRQGDRVEILRPLMHEPKETRRRLAGRGRTMGRSPKGQVP